MSTRHVFFVVVFQLKSIQSSLICIIRIVQTRNENFFQVRSPLENIFHFQNNKVNYILVDINSLTSHTLEFLAHEKKRLDKNHHSFSSFLFVKHTGPCLE